jgi:branched-chain amino acid transport system ATP-binding protein
LLKINELNVYYGGIHALRGIDMNVERGKIISLIGANGAGKSTTLRSIVALERPSKGSIVLEDKDLVGQRSSFSSRRKKTFSKSKC